MPFKGITAICPECRVSETVADNMPAPDMLCPDCGSVRELYWEGDSTL